MALRFIRNANRSRQNFRRHEITFEEAESSFADPRALVFQDEDYSTPDHSRMISIAVTDQARIVVVLYYVDPFGRIESFGPEKRCRKSGHDMPNAKTRRTRSDRDTDELPDELDFSKLTFLGRGLFAGRIKAGGRQVRLAADVAKVFRNEREVNDALRLLIRASKTVMKP